MVTKQEAMRNQIRSIVRRFKRPEMSARFDTSDVVQEVEVQLWEQGLTNTDDESAMIIHPALMKTIAKGHLAKQQRTHSALKRSIRNEVGNCESLISLKLDTQELVQLKDLSNWLLEAIKRLDKTDQEILHLRFFCDMQFKQIADEIGISIHRLRSRYMKTIATIKSELELDIDE